MTTEKSKDFPVDFTQVSVLKGIFFFFFLRTKALQKFKKLLIYKKHFKLEAC